MANESTPLIQTVRVAPPRRRYRHDTCRRFCTIACTCVLVLGFASFLTHVFLIWPYHHHHGHHSHYSHSHQQGKRLSHQEVQKILLETPTADHAEEWSRYYTSGPHLAGKNFSQADWTREKWQSWGVDASIAEYDVYINYPLDHSLSLLKKSEKDDSWTVTFDASLTEAVLDEDPTTALDTRVPTFHGYSASGNVTGQFVYVNYGTYQDYQDLVDAGINLKGKIAIARYGGIFRGLKVKRAQELGMVGTVIYSDPGDDGDKTEANGYEQYPKGPARHESSVQRGSVQFLSIRPGDPTTPGYPSKPGVPRAPADDSIPSIPSIPISYVDALPILKALNGHGPKASDLSDHWTRNLGLGYKGIDYNVGPSPAHVLLNLHNEQEYVTTPQWDVIGVVNGTIPNEVIVVGNHRDAWIAGGAGDPNSGSAVLNEVVRSVGKAVEAGWKPLRTIVFGSWDGEEYGLIGSTEWVEEYLPWLSDANVAYINVDVAASGSSFGASAAPLLNQVLRDATHKVPSPNQTVPGQSVGDVWDGKISTMGSGSDFTAFQDFAGVPSIDMGFKAGSNGPVYHYHSNYDSFHWMHEYGDPGFKYHLAMSRVLGVLLSELADTIVIPFGATEYADALGAYLDQVEAKLKSNEDPATDEAMFAMRGAALSKDAKGSADAFEASLRKIRASLSKLRTKAVGLDERAAWANKKLRDSIPWWNIIGKIKLWTTIAKVNVQYKFFERHFLFEGGLDKRSWFKHVVFAPGLWTGYSGAVYPGLVESIDAKDYINGLKWAGIIDRCVNKAAESI
ncbi:glutamate carboxypeptidase 2 [Metarhizium brunneum]